MVIAVFINDKGSSVYVWDSNYICEYSEEERAAYHTIIVYDEEDDKNCTRRLTGRFFSTIRSSKWHRARSITMTSRRKPLRFLP